MQPTRNRKTRQREAPLVQPATFGEATSLTVAGVSWRLARELARARGVRVVLSGARVVAIDVASWLELARPVGDEETPTEEPATSEVASADDVLSRLGLRRSA